MRCFFFLSLAVSVVALGCTRRPGEQAGTANTTGTSADSSGAEYGELVIGEPVAYKNLTIFPITSKTPKNDDRFITLDEGLAAGTVKIIETGAAGNEEESNENDDPFAGDDSGAGPDALGDDHFGDDAPDVGGDADENDEEQGRTQDEAPGEPRPAEEAEAGNDAQPAAQPAPQENNQQAEDQAVEEAEIVEQVEEAIELQVDGEQPIPFPPTDDNLDDGGEVSGDVNKLMVLNTSGKPLFLMPGEVISGGKQDRTIGQEIVIASSDKPMPIDVFCVERGRWAGRSIATTAANLQEAAEFSGNLSLVVSHSEDAEELAEEAQRGRFVASVGQVSKDVRKAVQQSKKQQLVWEEVSKANAKTGNNDGAGNFAANYLAGEIAVNFEPYIEKLKPVADTERIVGVAVAVDGKMLSVDVFESTPLFKKLWPKLLKSYSLDAVAAAVDADPKAKPQTCTLTHCVNFLKDAEKADTQTEEQEGGQIIARREAKGAVSFSYYDAEAAELDEAQPAAAGGFGGGVHTTILAH